ncbi:MAG: YceI family protein, partial [Ilumatobacteraceae bacterium]
AEGLEGWLELDSSDGKINNDQASRGHLEFPIDNLKSGNPLEDREMRRRTDARRYPTISGDLKAMKQTGDTSRYLVSGDLTFRGVARTYEDEMTVEIDGGTVNLAGQSTFDIRDFGMEPPRILMLRVQPEVTVRVEIVAEKDS